MIRRIYRRLPTGWWSVLALSSMALGATCASPPANPPAVSQVERAQKTTDPLRLAPPRTWQRLSPEGGFFVSPLYSPDGRWVAVSGLRGVGLYVVSTDGGSELHTLDAAYRGPRGWSDSPPTLHFGHAEMRAWREGSRQLVPGQPVFAQPLVQGLGWQVHQSAHGIWYSDPQAGTVTFQPADGLPQLLVDYGAWGARVSPTGTHVAWCTGTLADPRLYVLDAATRQTRELGVGVHPAWFPDGKHLVFARPAGVAAQGGLSRVTGAELMLHEVSTGQTRALTDTPSRVEMEPAVAPDGRSVVFADWDSGGVFRAAVGGGAR